MTAEQTIHQLQGLVQTLCYIRVNNAGNLNCRTDETITYAHRNRRNKNANKQADKQPERRKNTNALANT